MELKSVSAVRISKPVPKTCRYADSGSGVRCNAFCNGAYCDKHKDNMPQEIKGFRCDNVFELLKGKNPKGGNRDKCRQ